MYLHLKSVRVTGLFGSRDISLDLPDADEVAFIHGPNGIGKSTVLRLIRDLLQRDFDSLTDVDFERLELEFSDGTSCGAVRDSDGNMSGVLNHKEFAIPDMAANQLELLRAKHSALLRTENESSQATRHQLEREIAKSSERLRAAERHSATRTRRPGRLSASNRARGEAIAPEFPKLSAELISTDRLRVDANRAEKTRREQRNAEAHGFRTRDEPGAGGRDSTDQQLDLVSRIRLALAEYAREAQRIDRSFPLRLVEALGSAEPPTISELLAKFEHVKKTRSRLERVQLLDEADGLQQPPVDQQAEVRTTLDLYLTDILNKLEVLDDIANRLSLFADLINSKFQAKQLVVDRSVGYRLLDGLGREINQGSLSSGEQHQLVLLYRLIFRESGAHLFLIDEPELSLHVGWQEEVVGDLERIASLGQAQFILATHSPVIIGERTDLLVDLLVEGDF